MPPTKTQVEVKAPAVAEPAKGPAASDKGKNLGGVTALQRAAAGQLPPPNGSSSTPTARAADVNELTNGGTGAAGRARLMRAMQGTVGNARISRLLDNPLQPKLTVGPPNDRYEQEADRTANAVMSAPQPEPPKDEKPKIQPKPAVDQATPRTGAGPGRPASEKSVMAKPESGELQAGPDLQEKLQQSKGNGRPLAKDTRSFFESRLGADLGNVNVHTGPDAAQMNKDLGAHAFTHGADIYFNEGKYDPNSSSGKHLLAHELTHTVQQGASAPRAQTKQAATPDNIQLKTGAPEIQAAWYNFSIPGTDYEFDPSLEGLKTAGNLAIDKAKEGATFVKDEVEKGATAVKDAAAKALEWIYHQISDLVNSGIDWLTNKFNQIKQFATSSFQRIKSSLGSAFSKVTSPIELIKNAFAVMDAGALETAWNAVSAGAKAAWQTAKNIVNGVLSDGNGIWNTVSDYVTSLFNKVDGLLDSSVFKALPDSLQSAARSIYNKIRSLWESIRGFWTDLWKRLTSFVQNILASIERFAGQIAAYAIGKVIAIVKKLKQAAELVEKYARDPKAAITPVVERIAGMIETQAPPKARETAKRLSAQAASGAKGPGAAGPTIQRAFDDKGFRIQRAPDGTARRTATHDEVDTNVMQVLSDQWKALNIRKMLWDTFVNMFYPPATVREIGRQFSELWNTDWANAVNGLFAPRNIFDDFTGFLHDAWSNFLVLLDFPLALWRRLNNILMLLMGYVTIILFLVGAAVEGVGALAGLALARAAGEFLFWSFITAESASALKAFLDLYTARQTDRERALDYLQIAGSVIGIGIGLALYVIFFLLGKLVSAVVEAVKGAKIEPPKQEPPKQEPPKEEPPKPEAPRIVVVDSAARLKSSTPVWQNGRWEWHFYDEPTGARFCEVYAEGADPSARPAGPRLTLTPKEAVLPDGTQVKLEAQGFRWTDEALRLARESYKSKWGVEPPELSGEIDWANLANFQYEFATLRDANPGMSNAELGSKAAANISFGRARIAAGYGDLRANMSNFGDITVERTVNGVKTEVPLQNVPKDVTIEAWPTGGGPPPAP